jgi:plastocyanin
MCANRSQRKYLRWHSVPFLGMAMMLTTLVAPIAVRAQTACVGDCTLDGAVTVDELLTMVNIALGTTAVRNALSGCTTTSPTPTPTPVTHTVVVGPGFAFEPAALTIQVGDTVEWSWASSGHNVVSGSGCVADGQFCSPNDSACATATLSGSGTIYSHTFTAAGTFPYFCSAHCALGMVGTITVQ